jgi:hypothetical protein
MKEMIQFQSASYFWKLAFEISKTFICIPKKEEIGFPMEIGSPKKSGEIGFPKKEGGNRISDGNWISDGNRISDGNLRFPPLLSARWALKAA